MIINIVAVLIVIAIASLIIAHIYYAVYDLVHFEAYKKRVQMEREIKLIANNEMRNYINQKEPVSATAAIYDSIYH